jgi:lysophospholipase L1-like esterase
LVAWGDSLTAGQGSTGGSGSNDAYPHRFEALARRSVLNKGVAGETSTQIKDRLVAVPLLATRPSIIWAGRNNLSSPSTVVADIATMIAALGHSNYLVLSVLNGSGEATGSANYTDIATINTALASTYGARYVDVRSHLVSLYNPGDPTDVTDHANDIPPTSLRSDTLHLNDAGYQAVANKVFQLIGLLGVS